MIVNIELRYFARKIVTKLLRDRLQMALHYRLDQVVIVGVQLIVKLLLDHDPVEAAPLTSHHLLIRPPADYQRPGAHLKVDLTHTYDLDALDDHLNIALSQFGHSQKTFADALFLFESVVHPATAHSSRRQLTLRWQTQIRAIKSKKFTAARRKKIDTKFTSALPFVTTLEKDQLIFEKFSAPAETLRKCQVSITERIHLKQLRKKCKYAIGHTEVRERQLDKEIRVLAEHVRACLIVDRSTVEIS